MKLIILALIFFLAIQFANAQSAGDEYAFTSDYVIKKFDSFTGQLIQEDTLFKAERGNIFKIKAIVQPGGIKGYSLTFWKFNSENVQVAPVGGMHAAASGAVAPPIEKLIDKHENAFIFFISDDDLKLYATNSFRKPTGVFKVDGIVLPVKLRFKNKQPGGEFDFEQSISVGPALSWQINYGGPFGTSSFSFLTGFNVTNISVDDKTVANNLITSKTTVLGLSPFVGLNVEYHSVTISLMSGFDIIPGQVGNNWAYRNSPWLGIGIGASIFSTPATKEQHKQ